MSDTTLKYPQWQNHYLQAMAETHPELLKSKISAAQQVVSLRFKQLAITTHNYEEQIALAAALKSLQVLRETERGNDSLSRYSITALHSDQVGRFLTKAPVKRIRFLNFSLAVGSGFYPEGVALNQ
jgi:hypothetical protein